MKTHLFSFLLIGCLYSTAQAGEPISIGIHSSLDFCYRRLSNHDGSESSQFMIDNRNENEVIRNGFTVGATISKPIKQFTLETGLFYASKGYKTKQIPVVFGSSVDPSGNEFVIFKYHYNYLDIPIKIYMNFKKPKTNYRLGLGFINSIYINNSTRSLYYNGSEYERNHSSDNYFYDYTSYNISLTGSAGIVKPLNKHLSLGLDLQVVYGISSIINEPVHCMFWNLGLNASLYYRMD